MASSIEQPRLLAEINACKAYRDAPSPSKTPLAGAHSSAPTQKIADAIDAADQAWPKLVDVDGKLQQAGNIAPDLYAKLLQCQKDAKNLRRNDTLPDGSLRQQLRAIYCDAVDLSAGILDIRKSIGEPNWNLYRENAWSELSRMTRRLSDIAVRFGTRVGDIVERASKLLVDHDAVIAAGLPADVADQGAKLDPGGFQALADELQKSEKRVAAGLVIVANTAIWLLKKGGSIGKGALDKLRTALLAAQKALDAAGVGLQPQSQDLIASLTAVEKSFAAIAAFKDAVPADIDTLAGLRLYAIANVDGRDVSTEEAFLGEDGPYQVVARTLRGVEAKALAAWHALRQRFAGLPADAENRIGARLRNPGSCRRFRPAIRR